MKKSKITFELDGNTYVKVMRNEKQIGQIWSEQITGTHPYPHNDSTYCLNSIQICGFDRISEIWSCGPFTGKKDCVVHFIPEDDYKEKKIKEYKNYLNNMINKGEEEKVVNFNDYCLHHI